MNRKLKNIIPFLFLWLFLFPLAVKFEHHHEHSLNKSNNDKHSSVLNEKCGICNFEFSVFSTDIENIDFQIEKPLANYCNNYSSVYFSNLLQSTVLLRAPPIFTNNI